MSVNNTGNFTSVSGFMVDYDEHTDKYILSIQLEDGIVQMKTKEPDMLALASCIIQSIYHKQEAQRLV